MEDINLLVKMISDLAESVNKSMERTDRLLAHHGAILFGNAKPGLITRMAIIEKTAREDAEAKKSATSARNRRELVFLAAMLTTMSALLIKLFGG